MEPQRGCTYKLGLGVVGAIVGYFVSVAIALGLSALSREDSPELPALIIPVVIPLMTIAFVLWGSRLDRRGKKIN